MLGHAWLRPAGANEVRVLVAAPPGRRGPIPQLAATMLRGPWDQELEAMPASNSLTRATNRSGSTRCG